jgi:hypothetical protein
MPWIAAEPNPHAYLGVEGEWPLQYPNQPFVTERTPVQFKDYTLYATFKRAGRLSLFICNFPETGTLSEFPLQVLQPWGSEFGTTRTSNASCVAPHRDSQVGNTILALIP